MRTAIRFYVTGSKGFLGTAKVVHIPSPDDRIVIGNNVYRVHRVWHVPVGSRAVAPRLDVRIEVERLVGQSADEAPGFKPKARKPTAPG